MNETTPPTPSAAPAGTRGARADFRRRTGRHRGVVSILAMMFIVIFSALAAAMAIVSQGNLRTAETYQRVNRALAAAETGLTFASYRLNEAARRVKTTEGSIDEQIADDLWFGSSGSTGLREEIINELDSELHSMEPIYEAGPDSLVIGRIPVGSLNNAPVFQIYIDRHPIAGEDYSAPVYQRPPYSIGGGRNQFTADGEPVSNANPITGKWLRVRSVGIDGEYERAVQKDYRIDKRIEYAIFSRNRVMIGRNVVVRGSIGSRFTHTDYTHGHPVQMRDNFHGLDNTLDAYLDALTNYLAQHDQNGDNRVRIADSNESGGLSDPETYDANGDGYVDAYDMFLRRYDSTGPDGAPDGALTMSEFSAGGDLIDRQLWQLINEMKYPPGTEFDWAQMRVREPGDDWVDASEDLSRVDNSDAYAKIFGEVMMEATRSSWESGAADGPYQHFLQGPITPDPPHEAPLTFDADTSNFADFQPEDFIVAHYADMASGDFSSQVNSPEANHSSQSVEHIEKQNGPIESVPHNAPHPYDYYQRPVYRNYVFRDVTIPKGTNALFVDCRFIGVTFVETAEDNDDPHFDYAGVQNPDGSQKYLSVEAEVNGQQYNDTKPFANNIRFHNCQFEGVIAARNPESFTHVRNKLQFTGVTSFNPDAPSLSTEERELANKSSLMAPQHSVDMGSFTEPASADEVLRLTGTIVAGVFDVRGQATVDGSLITTYEPTPGQGPLSEGGNPAAFNTTIGYFESEAGDNESEIPDGGYGKILLRYDPTRDLPDGIYGPVQFYPDADTYREVTP